MADGRERDKQEIFCHLLRKTEWPSVVKTDKGHGEGLAIPSTLETSQKPAWQSCGRMYETDATLVVAECMQLIPI